MGSGPSNTTTTQKFEPPDYTKGTWQDFLTGAETLTQQPYEQYGGMTIAPWNGTQDAAAGLTASLALNGSPDMNAARASNMATSQGQFLGNPYATDQYVNQQIGSNADLLRQQYTQMAQPANDAAMARAGAFGGSGAEQQRQQGMAGVEKSIGDMANSYRLQNAQQGMGDYRSGVGQMLGANSQALGFNQADMSNSQALMGVGNSQNQYIQALLNQQRGDWSAQQGYPLQQLGILQQALQSASGSGGSRIGTSSDGSKPSWVTAGLGGLSGLAGLLGGG
jgi:hypothetical protein